MENPPEVKTEYVEDLGLVKGYRCPHCGGEVELHHIDDVGTKWFLCRSCGEYCTKPKSPERERLEEELKPAVLSHLNMIEDPSLAGRRVIAEGVVSSTSIPYLAPKVVEATYEEKGEVHYVTRPIFDDDPVNLKLVAVNEDVKHKRIRRFLGLTRVTAINELEWRTVYMVRVRPPVFTLEKRGEKIVDERGFEYKAYDIYVVSEKPIVFQPSSLIRVEGLTLPNPRTQKTTLLAYRIEFPEETSLYDEEKIQILKKKLEGENVKGRVDWILNNFERFSQIVGRRNLAFAGFLCFFTPTWVKFNGEVQRGWGNIMFIGDTTTAKSETIRKLIMLLKAGMLITAETASTVGLTGTATQVEKEGWFVDWGFLVLCDRKLLAVDGAHKLTLANWAALAESERSGVVTIAKAAKNSAYARTRQIKIANPIDREAGKYLTKTLASFLYPCQSLTTVLDKTSIARLDLAVFSDHRDVKPEEINQENSGEYDRDLELLSEALRWCWSGKAKIIFEKEAVKLLLEEATELYNAFFCDEIPLCSIDMKWKLARLSAALAFLTLSTEDFESVIVTKDHVEKIVEFIRNEYSKAGLNILSQYQLYEKLSEEDAENLIYKISTEAKIENEEVRKIIEFIVLQGRVTRDEIRTKFGLSENKQLRPLLAVLSSENLIRSGRGLYAEPKLIQLYKIIKVIKVNKGKTIPPNKNGKQKEIEKVKGVQSDLDKLDNLDTVKGPLILHGSTKTFEQPQKRVEGRGCYDCAKFHPSEKQDYIIGTCDYYHGAGVTEATLHNVLKQGCEGFEFKIRVEDSSDGSRGLEHWNLWKEKEGEK